MNFTEKRKKTTQEETIFFGNALLFLLGKSRLFRQTGIFQERRMSPVAKVGIIVLLCLLCFCNWASADDKPKSQCFGVNGTEDQVKACADAEMVCKLNDTNHPDGCAAKEACGKPAPTGEDFVCDEAAKCCSCKANGCNAALKGPEDENCDKNPIMKKWKICDKTGVTTPGDTGPTPPDVTDINKGGVSVISAYAGTTFLLASLATYLTHTLARP